MDQTMKLDIIGNSDIYINKNDSYGGCSWNINLSPIHSNNLIWLENFRREHEKETKLREENPALKTAWDNYQLLKELVK